MAWPTVARRAGDSAGISPGRPLRTVVREFVEHYHAERNQQGLSNIIPFPSRDSASRVGRIGRRQTLSGVLSFYERTPRLRRVVDRV
jgi:hypothetical protein